MNLHPHNPTSLVLNTSQLVALLTLLLSLSHSFCAANEVFFIAVYLLAFYPDPNSVEHRGLWATAAATFPIMAIKAVISCVHLYSAAYNIAAVDADRRTAESSKAK